MPLYLWLAGPPSTVSRCVCACIVCVCMCVYLLVCFFAWQSPSILIGTVKGTEEKVSVTCVCFGRVRKVGAVIVAQITPNIALWLALIVYSFSPLQSPPSLVSLHALLSFLPYFPSSHLFYPAPSTLLSSAPPPPPPYFLSFRRFGSVCTLSSLPDGSAPYHYLYSLFFPVFSSKPLPPEVG